VLLLRLVCSNDVRARGGVGWRGGGSMAVAMDVCRHGAVQGKSLLVAGNLICYAAPSFWSPKKKHAKKKKTDGVPQRLIGRFFLFKLFLPLL